MTRDVTLVLVDGDGEVRGALPSFAVELPWWMETASIVAHVSHEHGVDVEVLRLLASERDVPHGGAVTYSARCDVAVPGLRSVADDVSDLATTPHPLRAPYAEVDGPARSLAWARGVLGRDAPLDGVVRAEQQRTWNLSAIWRLHDGEASYWVKQVPEFFAHEAAVLAWLGERVPDLAPPLVGADDQGRMLLAHVEGTDLYGADPAMRARIAARAHEIQVAGIVDADALVARGVPDRRGARLVTWIRDRLDDVVGDHPAGALLDDLDRMWDAVQQCGLPDTLVHGDAHPGNVIEGERMVVVDWGDSVVGSPVLDVATLTATLSPEQSAVVVDAWCDLWSRTAPGCEPRRALELVRPVSELRMAAVYADFLARIEPTERVYHRADVPERLDAAVAAAAR
jgi:hypothetical protein